MEVQLVTIGNTPVFSVQDASPHGSRVYGATFDKVRQRWLFPAFPPFIENVLHDIENVYNDVRLSDEAEQWCVKVGSLEQHHTLITEKNLPVASYEHQLQGTAELLYYYRWILQWEMGTGKSKVVIDAIHHLQTKTLILCPLIALDNWKDEITLHSGGALRTLLINGSTSAQKLKQLQSFDDYDVIVATFDTARIYGTPRIFPKTAALFNRARVYPHHGLKKILQRVNNQPFQVRMAQDWLNGTPPRKIKAEIAEFTEGKPQWILDLPYETAVADESHRIKNRSSRRTKVCLQLSQKAARRYLLSGTLAQGDPRHLYPQLRFLAPYVIQDDWRTFCEYHLVKSPRDERIVVGFKNMHVLNAKVESISSEKKLTECVDLPERRFEIIPFELSSAQKRDYNEVISTRTIERADGDPIEIANGAIRISKLLQLCSGFVYTTEEDIICDTCKHVRRCVEQLIKPGTVRCTNDKAVTGERVRTALRYPDNPKLGTLRELLTDLLVSSKVIIWANFEQELDDIAEMLTRQKYGYVRVDGSTTKHIRKLAAKFKDDPNCVVYLAQVSTGIAITLNSAAYSIYYSRDWSLENRSQSLFRNFRIGQDQKTVVYDLCARGSIEMQQLTALQSKADISTLLTGHQDCTLCNQYRKCVAEGITPWTTHCVLRTGVTKKIAKARKI